MSNFSISFSRFLDVDRAVGELASAVEADLGASTEVAGGLLFATAAAGSQAAEVGRALGDRWPRSALAGTSFEGLVSGGRVWRDEPAVGLLAWRHTERDPTLIAFEPDEVDAERLADGMLGAARADRFSPADLVLLFPDAHGLPPVESWLTGLEERLGRPTIVGSAASGIDGLPPNTWVDHEAWQSGGLIGLIVPVATPTRDPSNLARTAGASRRASDWLEVTSCRSRWIDRLEGDFALSRIAAELSLDTRGRVESQLDRLLVRVRRRVNGTRRETPELRAMGDAIRCRGNADDWHDEERYIVGVDERRGSISMPIEIERGDRVALAWPDAALAREGLEGSMSELGPRSEILQFACRARDAGLHGDPDVESAWVAAHADEARILGTVAPFQLGPGVRPDAGARVLVHSTVLAALGSVRSRTVSPSNRQA